MLKITRYLISSFVPSKYTATYFFWRILRRNIVVKIHDKKMLLNLRSDTGISRDLFLYRNREIMPINYLAENNVIQKDEVIFEIGANIGYYTLFIAKFLSNESFTYALEPVEKNIKILQKNIALNNLQNISVHKLAIGDTTGTTKIYVPAAGNVSSIKRKSNMEEGTAVEDVLITTGDDFLKDKKSPTFIRMDIEGYEYNAIRGMKNTLVNKPKLLIEFHPHILSHVEITEILSILKESGYTKVVAMTDPYRWWVTPKGTVRYFLRRLTQLIGDTYKLGTVKEMSLTEFETMLLNSNRGIHGLIT